MSKKNITFVVLITFLLLVGYFLLPSLYLKKTDLAPELNTKPLAFTKKSEKSSASVSFSFLKPVTNERNLLEKIKEDDICSAVNTEYPLTVVLRSIINVQGSEAIDSEVDSLANDVFSEETDLVNKSEQAKTIIEFVEAVLSAGLFYSDSPPEVNYKKSQEIFEKLIAADNTNGIYHLFYAYVLAQLNYPQKIIKQELLLAFHADKYILPLDTIEFRLLEKSFANATTRALYIFSDTSIPRIHYALFIPLIFSFIEQQDSGFNGRAIAFAKKIIPESVLPGQIPNLKAWEHYKYSFALRVLKKAWPQSLPNEPLPNYLLYKNKFSVDLTQTTQIQSAVDMLLKSRRNFYTCDRRNFDILYTEEKIIFSNREN